MPSPVVHLELLTGNLARACDLYAKACGWRAERVTVGTAAYQLLDWGGEVAGGVVECPSRHAAWLPYVEVERIEEATERARALGATVLVEPREGPAGWRSVVALPDAAAIAFWQPKR